MAYLERYVKLAKEVNFSSAAEADFRGVNYALRCDMSLNEHLAEDEIVSAPVDQVSRGVRQREITGTLEHQFINPAMFRFSLGHVYSSYVTASQCYYKFSIIANTPSFSLEKGLQTPIEVARYIGTKINLHRLTLDRGEDVTQELTLVSKNLVYGTGGYSAIGSDITVPVFTYYEGQLKEGANVIAGVQRAVVETNRNLTARWSSDYSQAVPRTPREFREGRCGVTGRIMLDEATSKFIQAVLANTPMTLILTLYKNDWNRCVITINNVLIPEAPDSITGREPYELEFPFNAAGSATGLDAIIVEWWYQALPADQLDGASFKY